MIKEKQFEGYGNSYDDTMPRLLNKWELKDSSGDDSYDDFMPGLLNRYELDDSSDNESDKCDNVKNNEHQSDKGLDYTDDLSSEGKYEEN